MARDCYGLIPDYHACFSRPDGRCRQSREEKYRANRTGRLCCEACEELGALPFPGSTPRCLVCTSEWTHDPVTGLPYCQSCEAVGGKRAQEAIAKRKARQKADRAFEARQLALVSQVRAHG